VKAVPWTVGADSDSVAFFEPLHVPEEPSRPPRRIDWSEPWV